MTTHEIKTYLEKELPEFTYKTDDSVDLLTNTKLNENKLWVEREGHYVVFDVSKVTGKKEAKKLKSFIELKWREVA